MNNSKTKQIQSNTNNSVFPQEFLNSMQNLLGDEYEQFLSSLNQPKQSAVFVNNKIDLQKFKQIVDFKIEPILYEKNGFYVEEKLGRNPLHHAGAIYVQEPSAMFTVNAHKFNGDELVLDMCASPGGKSIQIANRIPNGVLVSNEINPERCGVLFSNIERMGLKNVVITNDTPKNIANAYANTFDVVLVDAPCSGEGMFRRGEQVVKEWNKNLPLMCAERQIDILEQANKALKQNGFLIYSTCTYSTEENEDVVKQFVNKHNYKLINIDADFPRGVGMEEAVRLYPHKVKGEGQFVAVLQKLEDNEFVANSNLKLKVCPSAKEFVNKYCESKDLSFFEYGNYAYYVKNLNLLKRGINYYSIGVRVGDIKEKRFEPTHNLFTAFGNLFKIKINVLPNDDLATKYLKGETFDVDLPDGFGAFLIAGCATGGFKVASGKFKNHYPKGLRNFK